MHRGRGQHLGVGVVTNNREVTSALCDITKVNDMIFFPSPPELCVFDRHFLKSWSERRVRKGRTSYSSRGQWPIPINKGLCRRCASDKSLDLLQTSTAAFCFARLLAAAGTQLKWVFFCFVFVGLSLWLPHLKSENNSSFSSLMEQFDLILLF